ncbi:MAG: PIN domain-containing protein [Anaerolineae bacterium]|nr:PIN domain-containing protein [Anaerolineae bacterium]
MVDAILDTAVIIDLLRNHEPAVAWFAGAADSRFAVNPIVWMEVISGSIDKLRQQAAQQLMGQFAMIYHLRIDLEWSMQHLTRFRLSHGVGYADCLIASTSARLQIPLFTRNLKHLAPLLGALAVEPY